MKIRKNITTTLFEGSVSVGTNSGNINKLKPGEQSIFNKKKEKFEKRMLKNPDIEASWRNNILIFDNEKLSDILKTLSRQYNVTFDINSEQLKQLRITARFNSNESVENALTILGKSAEFRYIKEKIITKY